MSIELYRQAQLLAERAEASDTSGERDKARDLYLRAAEAEEIILAQTPESLPRTRTIAALSAVSLYWRADAHSEVIRAGSGYLQTMPKSQVWAEPKIRRMVTEAQQALAPAAPKG